jgi:peptidyl-prolyl cis-trans isomerase A (cyclophilin A)
MHLFVALLLACNNAELEGELARTKQRVADLEKEKARLEEDKLTQKATIDRLEDAARTAKRMQALNALGVRPGQKVYASFVTSAGAINCALRAEEAPETVLNFVQLANGRKEWKHPTTGQATMAPLYNGTIFHRVIPGFMIQGGDPIGTGTGGPGYTFADEVGAHTVFDKPGLLAMANRGPDTNGSQFFITDGTPSHLNGKHTIFGDCTELQIVKAIAGAPRDPANDKPFAPTVVYSVATSVR